MKKHQRDSQGKAIKWIRTSMAKRYLVRKWRGQVEMVLSYSLYSHRVNEIIRVEAKTPEERINKSLAIAEATLHNVKLTSKILQVGIRK